MAFDEKNDEIADQIANPSSVVVFPDEDNRGASEPAQTEEQKLSVQVRMMLLLVPLLMPLLVCQHATQLGADKRIQNFRKQDTSQMQPHDEQEKQEEREEREEQEEREPMHQNRTFHPVSQRIVAIAMIVEEKDV